MTSACCHGREGAPVRVDHEEGISLIGLAGRDHGHHGHAVALGGQREERLVLDLLPTPGQDALGPPVPDRVPRGGNQLAVSSIPAEGLDQERLAVGRVSHRERHASRLQGSVLGGRGFNAQFSEHLSHLLEGQPPSGRAEEEVHQRGGPEPDQEPSRDPDRQRGTERNTRDHADPDQPSADLPQGPR